MAQSRTRKNTNKMGWRLIPRVRDIGYFEGLLVSRRRLVIGAVGVTAAALLVNVLVSNWMRESSGSPMLNVLVIALMLCALIIAAYIDALLVGDLFFPGRWREQMLHGDNYQPETWEDEQAAVKEYNVPFLLVALGLFLALAWGSQLLTGGFMSYYQNVGFALSLMRSDDPEDRLLGLEAIANPLYEEHWQDTDLQAQVAGLVDDADPAVQSMAIYVAGRLSVAAAADPILEVYRDPEEEPEVRGSAAMALGRLKWDKALAYMASGLKSPKTSEDERLAIVRGFALMANPRAGDALGRLLESCGPGPARLSEALVINTFYALRTSGHAPSSDVALSYLRGEACGGEVSRQEQCAAADALRYIAEDEHLEGLQRAYPALPVDYVCDYEMWNYRDESGIELVEKEPLRAKIVRAVGNRQNYDSYEWLWNVGADEAESLKTRKVAEIYVRGMLEAYERDKSVRHKR